MGTHAGRQTSRESLVWGKEISCLKERDDLVQANMPNNLCSLNCGLTGRNSEIHVVHWRAKVRTSARPSGAKCELHKHCGEGGVLQAGHSWPGTHRGTAGLCPPTDSVIWEEWFTSTLLGCQLDTSGKRELQLRLCFHQSGQWACQGGQYFLDC